MSQRPLIKEGRKGIPSYHHGIMCVRLCIPCTGGTILLTYEVAFASLQLEGFFRAGFSLLLLFSSGAADAKTTLGIGGEREERGGAKDGNVEYGTLKVTGWMEEEGKRRTIFRGYSCAPPFPTPISRPPHNHNPTDRPTQGYGGACWVGRTHGRSAGRSICGHFAKKSADVGGKTHGENLENIFITFSFYFFAG